MLLQVLQKLRLKRLLPVVFLLIGDVPGNRIGVGLADAERAIPGLPPKLGSHRPPIMPNQSVRPDLRSSCRLALQNAPLAEQ